MLHNDTNQFSSVVHPLLFTSTPSTTTSLHNGPHHLHQHSDNAVTSNESHSTPKPSTDQEPTEPGITTFIHSSTSC